jgi:hypothetical protein
MFTNFTLVLGLVALFLITLLLWVNVSYGDQAHVGFSIFMAAFSTTLWVLFVVALIRQARKVSVGQPS